MLCSKQHNSERCNSEILKAAKVVFYIWQKFIVDNVQCTLDDSYNTYIHINIMHTYYILHPQIFVVFSGPWSSFQLQLGKWLWHWNFLVWFKDLHITATETLAQGIQNFHIQTRQCHRLPICLFTSDLTIRFCNQKQDPKELWLWDELACLILNF